MKKTLQKAFTMVELLIVIGIIGTLSVVVIANLNPGETQKKLRDTERIKGVTEIYNAIEAHVNAGNFIGATASRLSTGTATSQVCGATNFTLFDLCPYLKRVPLDPRQGRSTQFLTRTAGTLTTQNGAYRLRIDAQGEFKVSTRLESTSNQAKLANDNGSDATAAPNGSPDYYEIFTTAGAALVP